MNEELEKLRAQIAATTTVMGSASVLIRGQAQRIRDLAANATDLADLKAALSAEADGLDAADNDLAAAVAENTSTDE